ncbi:hypothetical protein [Streptomyces sp. SID3212]|uniref:hypothetical protein n=1 Tax=Streptomyces sp. SID3212 TaxID=2690259 RepID=UPI001F27B6AB|nr:hypothetical protein [Streptomyces sp. SID3212]
MIDNYRPGDVLVLECPFTETTVTEVFGRHVSVRWPWLEVDPPAENMRWNGGRHRHAAAARVLPRPPAAG